MNSLVRWHREGEFKLPRASNASLPELRSVFDAERYLQTNPDVAEAGLDPWEHFVLYGFSESRAPAPLIDVGFLRSNYSRSSEPLTHLDKMEAFLASLGPDDFFGPSPYLCPAWVACQTGRSFRGLAALLKVPLESDAPFSPHPGLRRVLPKDGVRNVGDYVATLDHEDFEAGSLISLHDYAQNHKDMKDRAQKPRDLFSHLWSIGLVENRLKYLGTSAPRHLSDDELLMSFATFAVRHALEGDPQTMPRDTKRHLPKRALPFDRVMSQAVQSILDFDFSDPESFPDLREILIGHVCIDLGKRPLVDSGADELVAAPMIRAGTEVTDLDLLSGRVPLGVRRVVYSVNLGRYDADPVPPDLPDCDYVMITDNPSGPALGDWRVVRPTLREADVKRRCLWYKCSPHRLFPNHDFSVWIDANVEAQEGAGAMLSAHEALSEVAAFRHPERICVYEEAIAVASLRLDAKYAVERAVERMRAAGYPADSGLHETNVLFARIGDLGVRDFFDEWWRLIHLGSRRDQLSFNFAAWRTGVEIGLLDGARSTKTSRFFTKRPHVSTKGRFVA